MVKDRTMTMSMTAENRWPSVIQRHGANRYDSSNLRRPIKADGLWRTLIVVAVLRLSEEILVVLNRFYVAQVNIILSDFADILAWFTHRA